MPIAISLSPISETPISHGMHPRIKRVPFLVILGIVAALFAVYLCCRRDPHSGALQIVFCGYQAETNGPTLAWFTLVNNHPWPIELFLLEPVSIPGESGLLAPPDLV